jgi:hypothetical protein
MRNRRLAETLFIRGWTGRARAGAAPFSGHAVLLPRSATR